MLLSEPRMHEPGQAGAIIDGKKREDGRISKSKSR